MIRVRIPATTANLGPGFDCMGLALELWNSFELQLGGEEDTLVAYGEGAKSLSRGPENLVFTSARQELERLGVEAPVAMRVIAHNTIPVASGLGSSSTATLAGIIFAHAIAAKAAGRDPSAVDRQEVLNSAVAVEGHGDNVAPALLGGFVVVVPHDSGVLTQRVPTVSVRTVVCVPEFAYLTTQARAALPETYSRRDAIFNIGHAMLVSEALREGDDALLAKAMQDRIHEPYRLGSIPGAQAAKDGAIEAGAICVALSGAGPGVVAFARGGFDRIGRAMNAAFCDAGLKSRYWILDASAEGTRIDRLPV